MLHCASVLRSFHLIPRYFIYWHIWDFFFFQQVITVIAASFFNYPTIVHYYEIYFNISPEAWYHDSVKTIFSSGPLVNFTVGITFLNHLQ